MKEDATIDKVTLERDSTDNAVQSVLSGAATWLGKAAARLGPLFALLLLSAGMSLATPYFLTGGNLLNVLTQTAVITILAIGSTVVIIGAGIDVSIGSLLSLSAVVVAKLASSYGVNPFVAILIGMAAGTLFGAVNGILITTTRIPDFIVTIGMLSTFRGIALLITEQKHITGLDETILWFGKTRLFDVLPVPVLIALLVALVTWYMLKNTRFGRNVFASGGNREAARLSGIRVDAVKIGTYSYMGLLCGIAGVILIGRINVANALVGAGLELNAIAASIIGGTNLFGGEGTVLGAILGALVMGVISNGLNLLGVNPAYQSVVIGLLIVAVVWLDQIRRRRIVVVE